MSGPCHVYVISVEGHDLCKIGISSNPWARLYELQIGSPFVLKVEHAFVLFNREHALRFEAMLHKDFARHNVRGEWFSVAPDRLLRGVVRRLCFFLLYVLRMSEQEAEAFLGRVPMPKAYHEMRAELASGSAAP